MVHILGVKLPDKAFTKLALCQFYGIGFATALRLCARFQIHDRCRVKDLTQTQVTALTSFLSSPSASATPARVPLARPSFVPHSADTPTQTIQAMLKAASKPVSKDALRNIKIELELKREMRENIAHQRMIGSYVGRRHAMGLPVRGQNTQTNANTARKLNRVDRFR